ncbi:MAG: pantetheine-phosphate adenylyltransferase [Eubacteriales bacterium]|nr:pantetheine-phosphate adenylyltransferase [Eubacteriales bacterium]
MKTWVYSGSFDPITCGHMDIITRGAQLCDKLVVGIGVNAAKSAFFTLDERLDMVKRCTAHVPNIHVALFDGLLVDFVREHDACAILRGIRSAGDYEYECQLASINRHLADDVDTVYLSALPALSFISSTVVRELAQYGAALRQVVPPAVLEDIQARFYPQGGSHK